MTDMTATEIAAAVYRLKQSMRDKGYDKAEIGIIVDGGWTVLVYPNGMVNGSGHITDPRPAREAFDESFDYVSTLATQDTNKAAEALRAALSAAREAGVDVAEIVGAGE